MPVRRCVERPTPHQALGLARSHPQPAQHLPQIGPCRLCVAGGSAEAQGAGSVQGRRGERQSWDLVSGPAGPSFDPAHTPPPRRGPGAPAGPRLHRDTWKGTARARPRAEMTAAVCPHRGQNRTDRVKKQGSGLDIWVNVGVNQSWGRGPEGGAGEGGEGGGWGPGAGNRPGAGLLRSCLVSFLGVSGGPRLPLRNATRLLSRSESCRTRRRRGLGLPGPSGPRRCVLVAREWQHRRPWQCPAEAWPWTAEGSPEPTRSLPWVAQGPGWTRRASSPGRSGLHASRSPARPEFLGRPHPPGLARKQTRASQAWPEASSYSTCRRRPETGLGHLQVPAPGVLPRAALVCLGWPGHPAWGLRVAGRTSGRDPWGGFLSGSPLPGPRPGHLGLCLCIPPRQSEWAGGFA